MRMTCLEEKHRALQGEGDDIQGIDSAEVFSGEGGQANLDDVGVSNAP